MHINISNITIKIIIKEHKTSKLIERKGRMVGGKNPQIKREENQEHRTGLEGNTSDDSKFQTNYIKSK